MSEARNEILNRLKSAVYPEPNKPDYTAPVYHSIHLPLDHAFKENLEKVNGSVYLCQSEAKLIEYLKPILSNQHKENIVAKSPEIQSLLKNFDISFSAEKELTNSIEVGITNCEYLIAQTGSVMMSSALPGGRRLFVYPPIHVIIARKNQVLDYLDTAYQKIQEKYREKLPSQLTLITGPSRTADIEKTLVMGAHGPRELHVLLY